MNLAISTRFIFNNLDASNPKRKFSFILGANDDEMYEILDCYPPMEESKIATFLDHLNETSDVSTFVRTMRKFHFICRILSTQQFISLRAQIILIYQQNAHNLYSHLHPRVKKIRKGIQANYFVRIIGWYSGCGV